MSTSDLYLINKASTVHLKSYQNGFGTGPNAWHQLSDKYINETGILYAEIIKKLIDMFHDLEYHEKLVLCLTLDRAYIPLDKIEDAGLACYKFGSEHRNPMLVNHWCELGNDIMFLYSYCKPSPYARGLGLTCTSVHDSWATDKSWLTEAWSIYNHV